MMTRRTLLLAGAGAALSACGGGGTSAPQRLALLGDSLASGSIAVNAGEAPRFIDVPLAQRLQEYGAGRFTVTAYAYPGTKIAEVVAGTTPLGDFGAFLASLQADTVLLRFGGSDAILGTDGDAFERDYLTVIDAARAAGKRVVVIGLIHSVNYEARALEFEARIAHVAQVAGVQFIDTQQLPFAGEASLVDGTHPNQAYSDLQARLITDALLAAGV